ncbi:MAG: hypothetical protein RBT71_07680 [Flavobacteriales bacterium]|jgi:hypothetical protein|nr:hypothetical protein [Flavobacteriales bacterium]
MSHAPFITISLLATGIASLWAAFLPAGDRFGTAHCPAPPPDDPHPRCVFMTVYEGTGLDSCFVLATPARVLRAEERALEWLVGAQAPNGGYGAGAHARQDIRDPHAVATDPATTAMVGMAVLRMGHTLDQGRHADQLRRLTMHLLEQVERTAPGAVNITAPQGTQAQAKLGAHIDVALTTQFLSNLTAKLGDRHPMKARVQQALNTCTAIVQRAQNADGSMQGDGWAGVLQSSFAASALESARAQGADVDDAALRKARDYNTGNFDAQEGTVAVDRAAGITLYAVSGSSRNAAAEARAATEKIERARKEGRLPATAPVTVDNLREAGLSHTEAERLNTAYQVYTAANRQAREERVLTGFGNNGGEEFLSFLQTGESMVIAKDDGWRTWYGATTDRLLAIQENDGSWQGHHCITSPVFCTATALLILSINNDIGLLLAQGTR